MKNMKQNILKNTELYPYMNLAVLFSGGKDSTYALWLAKESGYEISCLITIESENKESYMFHTPLIEKTKLQTEVMKIPLIIQKTKGKKEDELNELEKAIKTAVKKYKIQGIVSGAVESVYQSSRIQKICDKLNLERFNPLWQKNQFEILDDLIKNKFEVIVVGVFAEGLDKSWIGKRIDKTFIEKIRELNKIYRINPAGEGGEYETFVLNCPLFRKPIELSELKIEDKENGK